MRARLAVKGMKTIRLMSLIVMASMGFFSCKQAPQGRADEDWPAERAAMVEQLRRYEIRDEAVLKAMAKIRRQMLIPSAYRSRSSAYGDHPSPIGHDQTISQPYIVAYMTERLHLRPGEKILEIGTGSGYQAAILAEMGVKVFTIEIVPDLAEHARQALKSEGYGDVRVLTGDGYKGWAEYAPYDAVIVTCAPDDVPEALVGQLADGGRMIVPVGVGVQRLVILRKKGGKVVQQDDIPVRFVPMVRGEEGRRP